jgi:anaerobic selenocysteine-containing dehydrogenase
LLEAKDPPIRALFIAANNPAITCPDTVKTRRGLAREDLFTVVHDPFMSVTARYADIVLPAATYLETEDFFRAYGTYYMQYSHRAVEPQGEAWSNLKLAQALAGRMGVTDPVFRMSEPEILRELLRGATGARRWTPTWCAMPDRSRSGRRSGQEYRTPSGKLEFYSETLAKQGLPPMPDWQPDPPRGKAARNVLLVC